MRMCWRHAGKYRANQLKEYSGSDNEGEDRLSIFRKMAGSAIPMATPARISSKDSPPGV